MAITETTLERAPYLAGGAKKLFINGDWVEPVQGGTFDTVNPATGEVIAQIALGTSEDVDLAVRAARAAFEGPWRAFTPVQRQNVLLKLADLIERHWAELRMLDILEMGSPIGPDISLGASDLAEYLRYFAGWATKIHGETTRTSQAGNFFTYTAREPIGVVAAIFPWNGPLANTVWKLAPILATGCTGVLKPAEEASLSPLRVGELIQELDLPPGVVNVVTGDGDSAGAPLANHPDVNKIAFTGSSFTGQKIVQAASGNLKRVTLELGGKSPDVVFADADLDRAIPGAAWGVFLNSGQICCAGTRVFVERPIYDDFVRGMAEYADALKVGNPLDPQTVIGPIVSQAQLDRVTGYLKIGKDEGARAVAGGDRLLEGELANGYFVPPTVFADVEDSMRIASEEIFGPVASVLPFDDVDEVVRRANSTQFGLGGAVWTRDVGKAHRVAAGIDSGVVWVNTYGQFDPSMPFGGYKMSGWGRELSQHGLEGYLNVKAVWINTD